MEPRQPLEGRRGNLNRAFGLKMQATQRLPPVSLCIFSPIAFARWERPDKQTAKLRDEHQAEAQMVEAVAGAPAAAIRYAAVPGIVEPTAAAVHAARAT